MNSGQASGAPFSTCLKQATHTALGQDCCLVPLELPAERPSPHHHLSPQTVIAESGLFCSLVHWFQLSPILTSNGENKQVPVSQAGPCEYSLLDANSDFLVLLELDKTLLGLSSEKYEHQIFLDNRTINVLSVKY